MDYEKIEEGFSILYGEKKEECKISRKEILEKAMQCATGNREEQYGKPEDNFATIAGFWETYLERKCVSHDADVCVTPEDVVAMMILLKVARIAGVNSTEDSWIDIAGYAACGGEIEGDKK